MQPKLVELASRLRILADPTRLGIVAAIMDKPGIGLDALVNATKSNRSQISSHLGILKAGGVVNSSRSNRSAAYTLIDSPLTRFATSILASNGKESLVETGSH